MEAHSLIVSLHDVTASTFERVRRQVEELASLGVARTSLLAVPHYHGRERLDESPALADWLRKRESEGHEVVLHGWRHDVSNLKSQTSDHSPRSWFYRNLYTAGEAEFLNLNFDEASGLIGKGLAMFHDLRLNARGFIAPAWLMNREVERAAAGHGLSYTNTISELIHLPEGTVHAARSCVWSTRAAWRRVCSLGWNSLLFQRLQGTDPLRISLHPCDLEYPAIWGHIKRLIQSACRLRKPVTYADWISQNATCPSRKRDPAH